MAAKNVFNGKKQIIKPLCENTVTSIEDDFPEFDDLLDEELVAIEKEMTKAEFEYMKKIGTRVMCLDIEALPRGELFPVANQDPVLQISSVCATLVPNKKEVVDSFVFTLGTCLPIEGANVVICSDECTLLNKWKELVLEFDPDVLSGFYFQNFDLPYLIQRAEHLGIYNFANFGRRRDGNVKVFKPREVRHVNGRYLVDIYKFVKNKYDLPSYKLNAVSMHFLGKEKDDVPFQQIPYLQRTSSSTRHKLAKYCLKDSLLVLDLFQKLNCLKELP